MTEKSMLWPAPTSGDGASNYTDEEIARMFRHLIGDDYATLGVLPGVGGELAPSGSASPVAIADGSAFIYGYFYWNTAPVNVVVPTPSIGTTGHRIVLRATWASRQIRITLLSSSDGVAALPAITQTPNTIFDLPICSLTITTGGVITITDERGFLHYGTKVNNAMLDLLSVATGNLQDLAVTTAKLANLAVTEGKLGDLSVATGKIQNGAVTAAKMTDGAGSGVDADLLDGVQGSGYALAAKGVTNGDSHDHNGGDGAQIPTNGIANLAVTAAKIANETITPTQIANRTRRFVVTPHVHSYLVSDLGEFYAAGVALSNTGTTRAWANFLVPDDYASGLTIKCYGLLPSGGTPGDVRISGQAHNGSLGGNMFANGGTFGPATVGISSNSNTTLLGTITPSGVSAGQLGTVYVTRDGDNGADTASIIYFVAFVVEYTADS